MNTATILALIESLLPVAEGVASIFIHNPASQHQFSLIVGTANALEPVVAGVASSLTAAGAASATITPAAAAPAAAPAAEPVIPAGVPSAHPLS